jgi:hypothetical protein
MKIDLIHFNIFFQRVAMVMVCKHDMMYCTVVAVAVVALLKYVHVSP